MIFAVVVLSAFVAWLLLCALFGLRGNAVEEGVWCTGTAFTLALERKPALGEWDVCRYRVYAPVRLFSAVRLPDEPTTVFAADKPLPNPKGART